MNSHSDVATVAIVEDDNLVTDFVTSSILRLSMQGEYPHSERLKIEPLEVYPEPDTQRCNVSVIVEKLVRLAPTIIILDLELCREDGNYQIGNTVELSGMSVLRGLRARLPSVPVIVFSVWVDNPVIGSKIDAIADSSPTSEVRRFAKRGPQWQAMLQHAMSLVDRRDEQRRLVTNNPAENPPKEQSILAAFTRGQ